MLNIFANPTGHLYIFFQKKSIQTFYFLIDFSIIEL